MWHAGRACRQSLTCQPLCQRSGNGLSFASLCFLSGVGGCQCSAAPAQHILGGPGCTSAVALQVDAVKRNCFKTLPHTLVIHLKRFEFDYETMSRWKVKDR